MASIACQRPSTMRFAALLLVGFLARAHGRLLVEQQGGSRDAMGHVSGMSFSYLEGAQGQEATESLPTFLFSTITTSPYIWFQQQLNIVAALEQALVQGLQQRIDSNGGLYVDSTDTGSHGQQEQLRQVGCARLRAALLNQAKQEQAELQASDSAGVGSSSGMMSSAGASNFGYVAEGNAASSSAGAPYEYVEYFGDYSGPVISRSVGVSQTRLRGAVPDLDISAASSSDNGEDPNSISEGRLLQTYASSYDYYSDQYTYDFDDDYYVDEYEEAAQEYTSIARAAYGAQGQLQPAGSHDAGYESDDEYGENAGVSEGRLLQLLEDTNMFSFGGAQSAFAGDAEAEHSYDDSYTTDTYDSADERLFNGDDNFEYSYDDYEYIQVLDLADAMLSKFETDTEDDEWADYIEQAYEYFTVYFDDEAYGSYTDVLVDDVPNALAALASIAELVVWAHMGNFVLEVRPAFSIVQANAGGAFVESSSVLLLSGEAYNDLGFSTTMFDAEDAQAFPDEQPMEVVNDLRLHFFEFDGSLNWGLVALCILIAGTVAMVVGFIVSWMSLRRSMSSSWVYVPQRPGRRCTRAAKGYEIGCDFGKPLMLRPEDCWGAVAVEHASQYVPTKLANDSVAKALTK